MLKGEVFLNFKPETLNKNSNGRMDRESGTSI
jgi:hypothetical protein